MIAKSLTLIPFGRAVFCSVHLHTFIQSVLVYTDSPDKNTVSIFAVCTCMFTC